MLAEGISRRGTLVDLWGTRGTQLQHRQVFERAGQPYPRRGIPIERLRQNNRNSFAAYLRTYRPAGEVDTLPSSAIFSIASVLGNEPQNQNDACRWARQKAHRLLTAS